MRESTDASLSEAERTYLRSGEINKDSYSEKQLRERIEQKQNNIGYRLNRLVGDLSLMYRSEYFEFEQNSVEIFEDMSIYNTISRALDNRLIVRLANIATEDRWRTDEPTCGEQFGYYIGGLLHMLLKLLPDGGSWDETLRGLLIFYLFVPDGNPKRRQNKLEEVADFRRMSDDPDAVCRALDTAGEFYYEIEFGYEKFEQNIKEKEFLDEKGIPLSETLCDKLRLPVDDEDFPEYPSAEELFEKNLSQLEKDSSFNSSIELNKTVISDIEYLKKKWRGPDRSNILEEMQSGAQRNNAHNIASGLGKSMQQNLVTEALKKMSVGYDEERWTTFPVVEKSDLQWEFTPYGELLVEYILENITNEEFARHGLPDEDDAELIAAALAQVRDEI